MEQLQRLVVCILSVRDTSDGRRLLLQRRHKTLEDTPYDGYLEVPQGKVDAQESIIDAARRELREESGLAVRATIYGDETQFQSPPTSDLWVSHPLICVVDRLQNHVGVAIIVSVAGSPVPTPEADNQQWYSDDQIRQLLAHGRIFPLNRPMLAEYLATKGADIRFGCP
jgi:8-oxo-dGTP pyrophosphatase MutT (NUDIX family)